MADRPKTTLSTVDIVERIKADHQAAKDLLRRFEQISSEGRSAYFHDVVTELVRHEVAEEHVVYPIIRHGSPEGAADAADRIAEQAALVGLLAQMEKLDVTSAEFESDFLTMRQSVLDHAGHEEMHTLPLLASREDTESRVALDGRYEHAKSVAPKHPHPHAATSPPGNAIFDPILAFLDRARDAVKGI